MKTTNQSLKTTTSLLAQYNNAKGKKNPHQFNGETFYPDRIDMKREIENLLEQEQNNWSVNRYTHISHLDNEQIKEAKRVIALYKEVFDWDTQYSVNVEYELSPSTMDHSIDVNSVEELQDYLNKVKEVEDPDSEESCWTQIDYGYEIYDVNKLRGGVSVDNLRLKDKNLELKEKEYEYSIILSIKSKKDLEYIQDNILPQSVLQQAAEEGDFRITASPLYLATNTEEE